MWLLPSVLVLTTGEGLAVLSGGDWMRHARYLAPYLPVLLAFGLLIEGLQIWMVVEAIILFPKAKGVLEEQAEPLPA